MQNSNSSERQIWCCGARSWALVIGWLQTIGSGSSIVYMILTCFFISGFTEQLLEEHHAIIPPPEDLEARANLHAVAHGMILAVFVIATIAALIQLIAGIFLIQGVNQQNVKKIKIWKLVQIIFLVFIVFLTLLSLFNSGFNVLTYVFEIIITIFSLWVVNVHQKELDTQSDKHQQEFRKAGF